MFNVANFTAANSTTSTTTTNASWWINFDLINGVQAGLPMDAVDKDGHRKAKGSLLEFFDWVMTTFKDIPINKMVGVEINGRKFVLWHGDGQPREKLDKSNWTAKVLD